jgi:hypothetical protein
VIKGSCAFLLGALFNIANRVPTALYPPPLTLLRHRS